MSTIFMYLIALVASNAEEPHYSMLKSYYLWRIIMGGKITLDHIFVTADTLRKLHRCILNTFILSAIRHKKTILMIEKCWILAFISLPLWTTTGHSQTGVARTSTSPFVRWGNLSSGSVCKHFSTIRDFHLGKATPVFIVIIIYPLSDCGF